MLIRATASSSKAVAATVKGLRETGQVLVVGVSLEPIEFSDYAVVARLKDRSRVIPPLVTKRSSSAF